MYGIKDGRYGLFPSDFVERMSPQAIRREMRMISKVTRSGKTFFLTLKWLFNTLAGFVLGASDDGKERRFGGGGGSDSDDDDGVDRRRFRTSRPTVSRPSKASWLTH